MNFEYLHKIAKNAKEHHGYYIDNMDLFYKFIDEFGVDRVHWGQPTSMSSSYFLRLLKDGSSVKSHQGDGIDQMSKYYSHLLDHGVLWRLKCGDVVCTALPYGSREQIQATFESMVEEFNYPKELRLIFLGNDYRFRTNGDEMILIYYGKLNEVFNSNCADDELRRRAIGYSNQGRARTRITSGYIRNKYISAYAKRRAHGICQLCENPAPFSDPNGEPYLESHHIDWLSDDGEDSIYNVVALCPNCHKKMHVLDLEEDIEKLKKVIEECENRYDYW